MTLRNLMLFVPISFMAFGLWVLMTESDRTPEERGPVPWEKAMHRTCKEGTYLGAVGLDLYDCVPFDELETGDSFEIDTSWADSITWTDSDIRETLELMRKTPANLLFHAASHGKIMMALHADGCTIQLGEGEQVAFINLCSDSIKYSGDIEPNEGAKKFMEALVKLADQIPCKKPNRELQIREPGDPACSEGDNFIWYPGMEFGGSPDIIKSCKDGVIKVLER